MSTDLFIKGFVTGMISLVLAWAVFSRYDSEIGSEASVEYGQKYRPLILGGLLPGFLLTLTLFGLMFYGAKPTIEMILTMCFDIFLHISLYYIILILILPFFRKRISARACALLWLLPNFLYLTQQRYMEVPRPLITIHAPDLLIKIFFVVWLLGFITFFAKNIISHLLFRKNILRNAVPVTDPEVLKLFESEIEEAAFQFKINKFHLVTTPDASSPLTIGLYRRSTRIILPEKNYRPDELQLIFRHELIHILREDSWTKFFMRFCTAICWFNPLMWMAMKKSAQDLELSCDETVLLDADEDTRNRYANLILNTAGDDRGFSTCLSASAASMRYRLKSIIKPAKRRSGALAVSLTFFALCMTCGYISLSYGDYTGAAAIYRNHDLSEFSAYKTAVTGGDYETGADNIDTDALTQYIADLKLQKMTGNYSYSGDQKELYIWYNTPYGILAVNLHTDFVKFIYTGNKDDKNDGWYTWHLPTPADWDYIDSIVPPLPTAKLKLSDGTKYGGSYLTATVTKLTYTRDETSTTFKDREPQLYEGSGIYGSRSYTSAAVTFSMPLISDAEIMVESWDYDSSYTITLTAEPDGIHFELPDYPAHYTITASFQGESGIYDTTFTFHIGNADSM